MRSCTLPFLLLFLVAGCSHTIPWTTPAERSALLGKADGQAGAIVLLRRREYGFTSSSSGQTSSERVQDVIHVVDDSGREAGRLRIRVRGGWGLSGFSARVIQPDGSVRSFGQADLLEDAGQTTDGHSWRNLSIQLPEVRPGTTIEYTYLLLAAEVPWVLTRRISDRYPVRRYEATVRLPWKLQGELRVWNVAGKPAVDSGLLGYSETRLVVEHVPALVEEPQVGAFGDDQPWWAFRLHDTRAGAVLGSREMHDWTVQLGSATEQLAFEQGPLRTGSPGVVDVTGCEDVACRIARAVDLTRRETRPVGWGDLDEVRTARECRTTKAANALERAMLLHQALETAGVEAHLAYYGRGSSLVDETFPASLWFNAALVYVPAQRGLAQARWVDPVCDHCRPGELPTWSHEKRVLRVRAKTSGLTGTLLLSDSEWTQARGTTVAPSTDARRHRLSVEAKGDARLETSVLLTGHPALEHHFETRGWGERDWKRQAEGWARAIQRTAQPAPSTQLSCVLVKGECTQTLATKLPGHATRDGARLVVPLRAFADTWDEEFVPRTRTRAVAFEDSTVLEEELAIALPAGCAIEELPDTVRLQHDAAVFQLEVARRGEEVTITRRLALRRGAWPARDYEGLRKLMRAYAGARSAAVACTFGHVSVNTLSKQ